MKKVICILSIFAMLISLCACGKSKENTENETTTTANSNASYDSEEGKTKETNKTLKTITFDEFKTILSDNGYKLYLNNEKDQCASMQKEEMRISVSYFTRSTHEEMREAIMEETELNGDEITKHEDTKPKKYVETGKNYEIYQYESDVGFMWTVIVDNICIRSITTYSSEESVEEAKRAINLLGYEYANLH